MEKYNRILSEKPNALIGALEWIDEEIRKEKAKKGVSETSPTSLKSDDSPISNSKQ